jgi:hypothetical protein
LALAACSRKSEAPRPAPAAAVGDPQVPPLPPTHDNPTPEALDRKARSEARLKAEGVPVASTLPVIETEAEAKVRAKDAVVDRAVALLIVAVKAEGLEQPEVVRVTDRFGASTFFTPKEKAFIASTSPDDTARAQFGWRYECVSVLVWALGFTPELSRPDKIVDAGKLATLVMKDKGPKKFRDEARLRAPKELLDEADLIYRYDWACVDARASGKDPPRGVDCEIVVERHRALNWLIGYQGQEWDDVSTDT